MYRINYLPESGHYGQPTTAIILEEYVHLILNGDHREGLSGTLEEALQYFAENVRQANPLSDHNELIQNDNTRGIVTVMQRVYPRWRTFVDQITQPDTLHAITMAALRLYRRLFDTGLMETIKGTTSSLFAHAVGGLYLRRGLEFDMVCNDGKWGIRRNDTIIILASEAHGDVFPWDEFNLLCPFGNLTELERWFCEEFWRRYV